MLQKLRDKTTGWIAVLIVAMLAIPFLFFGIENYFSSNVSAYVAKVGEHEITPDDFRNRFEEYRRQMRQMMGDNFDGAYFEQPEVKRQMLDRLVEEQLMLQTSERLGMVVAPAQLQKEIRGISAFQTNGNFDPNLYRMMLQGQAMTPRMFERRVQRDLEVRALPAQISSSAFVTDAYVFDFLRLRDQRRDVSFLALEPPARDTIETPKDADIEAFYQANTDRYQTLEQVSINYLEIDAAGIEVPTVADEASLLERYEEQSFRFLEPEQRLLSHILVAVEAGSDADAQRAAREKIEGIAARLAEAGADFEAIARETSEDVGSSSAGGDLGWIERGVTDQAFEDAAFALEPGKISEPVLSENGWHLISLREVRDEVAKPFADVRGELEAEYLESERERRFSEQAGKLVDLIYRDPTSLQLAARELGLEVKSAGPFGRTGGQGIAANPEVQTQAFSSVLISEGTVSDPIELGSNHVAVIQVAQHMPASAIALAEVRDRVIEDLTNERLGEAAKARAESLLERLNGGESLADIAASLELEITQAPDSARFGGTVEAGVVQRAFQLPHPAEGKPSSGLAELGANRFALLAVSAVRDADPSKVPAAERDGLRSQLAQGLSTVELRGFVDSLRQQTEVRVAEERM